MVPRWLLVEVLKLIERTDLEADKIFAAKIRKELAKPDCWSGDVECER